VPAHFSSKDSKGFSHIFEKFPLLPCSEKMGKPYWFCKNRVPFGIINEMKHPQTGAKLPILIILGPSASGKSALAVSLAKKFNGEIVSADSRQVYTGLDIGTGKITKKEMCGIPHHLLDVANPKNKFNVEKFKILAEKKILEIASRNKLPILCGGTGFYIETLVNDIHLPNVPPNNALRKKLNEKSAEQLFEKLKKLDLRRAKTIDPKNKVRIIRAIEIVKTVGKVPLIPEITETKSKKYNPLFIGIKTEHSLLKKKIERRLIQRMKMGMIDEAKKLHEDGLSWKRMEELGLEYRYLALHLQKKMSKEEMIEKLKTEIWKYARRQKTWFKRDKRIKWFEISDARKIENEVRKFFV
jgi:tRNA dimethylallyltransferase